MFLRSIFERQTPHITGTRVYIRPPSRWDCKEWVALRRESRSFLAPWEPSWPADASTSVAFRRRLHRFKSEWRYRTAYPFFIFEHEEGRLVGGITLSNLRRGVAQSVSVGYWTGAAYVRRGYMYDALRLTVGYAFDELGFHRMEAACLPHNAPSRRLLAKIGFQEEGLAREYLCINGRWQDHISHALLNTDPRPAPELP
ncbi:MAG: 30S ribosomal protein S5 alanine N-acetyltransferase [Rhodospirillaceae bacterium]|nr:30S ribosomal protein S5 alanine N-acetyltransferase [Rhodospirillaceae bacterium]